MNANKNRDLDTYIYIRVGEEVKDMIKERARKEGSNMTIWARQTLIKALAN